LLEVDAVGKEVFAVKRKVRDVITARKLRRGQIALITDTARCAWLDEGGKETAAFAVPAPQVLGAGIDVLPNRAVLVPDFAGNRVVEYDADGNIVWQAPVKAPTAVARLPGRRTLVVSTTARLGGELDRGGEPGWQSEAPARPLQAAPR